MTETGSPTFQDDVKEIKRLMRFVHQENWIIRSALIQLHKAQEDLEEICSERLPPLLERTGLKSIQVRTGSARHGYKISEYRFKPQNTMKGFAVTHHYRPKYHIEVERDAEGSGFPKHLPGTQPPPEITVEDWPDDDSATVDFSNEMTKDDK